MEGNVAVTVLTVEINLFVTRTLMNNLLMSLMIVA